MLVGLQPGGWQGKQGHLVQWLTRLFQWSKNMPYAQM